jgi:hypothetical protein
LNRTAPGGQKGSVRKELHMGLSKVVTYSSDGGVRSLVAGGRMQATIARTLRIALFLCWLPALRLAAQQPEAKPIANLTQATGEVTVRHEQNWASVDKAPVGLWSGDKVATEQGRAEIHFISDDSTVVLDVGGNITITETPASGAQQMLRRIEIFVGDFWFSMKKTLNQNTQLVTPTAVGGLRGTEGTVHVEDDSKSEFSLKEGELAMRDRPGAPGGSVNRQPYRLTAGHTLHSERGQPFRSEPYKAPPVRPEMNVAKDKLPKPRQQWQDSVRPRDRTPPSNKLPKVSDQKKVQAQKQGQQKAKPKAKAGRKVRK